VFAKSPSLLAAKRPNAAGFESSDGKTSEDDLKRRFPNFFFYDFFKFQSSRDRCYYFENVFSEKLCENIGVLFTSYC
jgi:hypothetical protein